MVSPDQFYAQPVRANLSGLFGTPTGVVQVSEEGIAQAARSILCQSPEQLRSESLQQYGCDSVREADVFRLAHIMQ